MEFDDYPFMESYNDEEFVFRFINDFDWDQAHAPPTIFWNGSVNCHGII